jgi:hypothetical protein
MLNLSSRSLGAVLGLALLVSFNSACTDDGAEADTDASTETGETEAETGEPPAGVFGDCANGGLDACMADSAQCLQDDPSAPSIGVCGSTCVDAEDCWAAPADGDAPVTCKALVEGDDGTCVLDCAAGQTCPNGMSCLPTLDICVFSVD